MIIKKIAAGALLATGLSVTGLAGAGAASAAPATYTIVINLFSNNVVTKTHIFNWGSDSFNTTTNNTTNNTTKPHHAR